MRLCPIHCSLLMLATVAALPAARADTVIDHANGYTLNSKGDLVQFASMAFDDGGKIIAVGSGAEVAARAPRARHVASASGTKKAFDCVV